MTIGQRIKGKLGISGFRRGGLVSGPITRKHDIPARLLDGEIYLVPAEELRAGDLVYINPADGKVYKSAGQPRSFRIPSEASIENGILAIPDSFARKNGPF